MAKTCQLPKHLHPDFRAPGVKPNGPVEIDWQHPITRGLKVCHIFNQNGLIKNLVGIPPTSIGGDLVPIVTSGAYAVDAPGGSTDQEIFYNGSLNMYSTPSAAWRSVYCRAFYDSAQDHALHNMENGSIKCLFWADVLASNLRPAIFAGKANYGTAASLPQNEWISWGGKVELVANLITMYVDGVLDYFNNETGTTVPNDNAIFIAQDDTGTRESDAKYEFIYLWDRDVSDAEFASINADPYQILKPVAPLFTFISDAAPPTGAIMNQLQQSNLGADLYNGTIL